MSRKDELIAELKMESGLTKKMLEQVPFNRKDWKPHDKSMTLGRLATHIAENFGWTSVILRADLFDFATDFKPPRTAASQEELLQIFQSSLDGAIDALSKATDDDFEKTWSVARAGTVMMQPKKKAAIRGWSLSHVVHHRGQLSVYLRLLDIPVPGMYGPSADER
jgi:uncharacterized damage-inducible protein DinB